MRIKTCTTIGLMCLATAGHASDQDNICIDHDLQSSPISIPSDDAPKQDPTNPADEWYWNGRLSTFDGHQYSYNVFLFRFTMGNQNLLWGQVSVTDLADGSFHQGSYLTPGLYKQTTQGFDLSVPLSSAPTATGGGGVLDHVTASTDDGIRLDLYDTSLKNPLIEFVHGHATYTNPETGVTLGDNFYYSRPLLATAGAVTVGGKTDIVVGKSWFDREWHPCCANGPVAWDWYAIQLDNDEQYSVYDIYVPGRRDLVLSRTVNFENSAPLCPQNVLSEDEFTLGHSGAWTSPHSGHVYPTEFTLDIPSRNLHAVVRPVVPDQEATKVPGFFAPWYEGGATVSGTEDGRPIHGQGFVELFGYL